MCTLELRARASAWQASQVYVILQECRPLSSRPWRCILSGRSGIPRDTTASLSFGVIISSKALLLCAAFSAQWPKRHLPVLKWRNLSSVGELIRFDKRIETRKPCGILLTCWGIHCWCAQLPMILDILVPAMSFLHILLIVQIVADWFEPIDVNRMITRVLHHGITSKVSPQHCCS